MAIEVSVKAVIKNGVCTVTVNDSSLQTYWRIVRCYVGGIGSDEKQYDAGQPSGELTLTGITSGTTVYVEILDYNYTIIGQGSAVATSEASYTYNYKLECYIENSNTTSNNLRFIILVKFIQIKMLGWIEIERVEINDIGPISVSYNIESLNIFNQQINLVSGVSSLIQSFTNVVPSSHYEITMTASINLPGIGLISANGVKIISTPAISIPSQFNWIYPKSAGISFNLTAAEWTAMQNKIDEWYAYFGLSKPYWYYIAQQGQPFTYNHYNEAVDKISKLNPQVIYTYSLSNSHKQYDNIKAEYLNNLVAAINHL